MPDPAIGVSAPERFENPHGVGGRLARMLWAVAWGALFRPTPTPLYGIRRLVLRVFGARVGKAFLHPSVRVWAPWSLELGDNVYVARDVDLYNVFGEIGRASCRERV